jgi:hypothetical protein
MMPNFLRSRTTLALLVVAVFTAPAARGQSTLPARYADSTFWRLMNELSEPGGEFRSDNLLSNETSFQWVVPTLQKMTRPDGVYLGVAPEQNFTFIAALRPKVAFIVDIRRGNALLHLMYKALFESSPNRVEFTYRLFGRTKPASLSNAVGVAERGASIKDRLTRTHGFALSKADLEYIDYVYYQFSGFGPGLRYNMGRSMSGGFGSMPSYGALMTETDSLGVQRSYLANDENYRVIKDMHERNVIIPFTGDFAGPKALRAFGQYVRDNKAIVQAIYVSNVEQYLWQDPNNPRLYYENVATLPTDSTTMFIRSATRGLINRQQSANSPQNELLCSVPDHLKAWAEGKVRSYGDVFSYCR